MVCTFVWYKISYLFQFIDFANIKTQNYKCQEIFINYKIKIQIKTLLIVMF